MPQAALLWSPGGADHEARLARAAAAGNGRAFSTLYDRHEGRVFNLALRITGSEEHAAQVTREAFLDALRALAHIKDCRPFGSCLLTGARNAAVEVAPAEIGAPEAEPEGDDDAPDFEAWQERIRDAALGLPVAEREALALAGTKDLAYPEVAAIVDTDPDAVPGLLARGRLVLHDELFGTTLAAAPPEQEDCAQALPLIAMRADGALTDQDDFAWLVEHLAHCAECRVRLDAVEEASAAYREWQEVAPPPTLLRDVMTAAARLAGGDWEELIGEREARRSQGRSRSGALDALAATTPLPSLRPALTGAGGAAGEALGSLRRTASRLASKAWRRRPQRSGLATAGLLAGVVLGLSAIGAGAALVLRGEDEGTPTARPIPPVHSATPSQSGRTFPVEPEPRPTERTPSPPRRKARRTRVITPVVATPRPQAERPAPAPPKRRVVPQAVAVPAPKPRQTPTPTLPPSEPPTTTPPAQTTPELPSFQPGQ